MSIKRISCHALLCALALPCAAQQAASSSTRLFDSDARALARENRQIRAVTSDKMRARAAVDRVEWTLTAGIAYSDDGDGSRSYAVPTELQAKINGGATAFALSFDLYDRVTVNGESQRGYGDPSLSVAHAVGPFVVGAGVTVPGGSDLGASHGSQVAFALYPYKFGTGGWGRVQIAATHDNGSPAGVRAFGQVGKIVIGYDLPGDTDIWLGVSRAYRRGAGGGTSLAVGYDFPISTRAWGPFTEIGGSLTASCGVSSGGNCGSISFDVSMPFK